MRGTIAPYCLSLALIVTNSTVMCWIPAQDEVNGSRDHVHAAGFEQPCESTLDYCKGLSKCLENGPSGRICVSRPEPEMCEINNASVCIERPIRNLTSSKSPPTHNVPSTPPTVTQEKHRVFDSMISVGEFTMVFAIVVVISL